MSHLQSNADSLPRVRFIPVSTSIVLVFGLYLIAVSDHAYSDDSPRRAHSLFEIQVLDAATKRGVPLVALTTVHDVTYFTDNYGRIAYDEPTHFGQEIFFRISAPGYRFPPDGFGVVGVRLKIEQGNRAEILLTRLNLAERMYRCTGQDQYRDSLALHYDGPKPLNGQVAGQDSVQVGLYRDKIYWFWGDTNRLLYPLGLFRMAGATSPMPPQGEFSAETPIAYDYFVDQTGFARAMVEMKNPEGVIWIDGIASVPNAEGETKMVAHFSRRPGLAKAYEQGMVVYNDQREVFEPATILPLEDSWRFLREHPVTVQDNDQTFLASGNPFPLTRVPADYESVMDPEAYESFSCTATDSSPADRKPLRDASGNLLWAWRKGPPTTQADEQKWLQAGLIKPTEARFLPRDVQSGDVIMMHSGTVFWNSFRKRWIMIAVESALHRDSPSFLGEVWYSESDSPQGPFLQAVKILTHDKQSFYNPCHHPFLDQDGGRVIYFEGTYCNTFTDSPPTPRYNYNQIMYRLELDQVAEKL